MAGAFDESDFADFPLSTRFIKLAIILIPKVRQFSTLYNSQSVSFFSEYYTSYIIMIRPLKKEPPVRGSQLSIRHALSISSQI